MFVIIEVEELSRDKDHFGAINMTPGEIHICVA
jgi:hypothetical protein